MNKMAVRMVADDSVGCLLHSFKFIWLLLFFLVGCGGSDEGEKESAAKQERVQDSKQSIAPTTDVETPQAFLLITLDTTRADHLQPYGEATKTPYLLELANRGGLFEQAWAVSPVTLPSHSSLFTGLLPYEHGVRNNGIHYLAEEHTTLAEILLGKGFRTAAFISAAVLESRYGLNQGFEVYDEDLSAGGARQKNLNAERPATATVDAALAWLKTLEAGERFFLWVHLFDPHAAYSPPEPWASQYSKTPYPGEIAYLDSEIGRLLATPEISSNHTLVMAIADHGESLGEHGESTHAMLAYESTLHIPWLVYLPGAPSGRRWDQPVSQVDLLPTVLDLLNIDPTSAEHQTGTSLAATIRGVQPSLDEERILYAETLVPLYTYGWSPLRTLRRGGWKYIEAPEPELYDLVNDPKELHNLAPQRVEETEEFGRALVELAGEFESGRSTVQVDSETATRLRSLGYLASSVAPERSERADPKSVIALHEAAERAQQLFFEGEFKGASSELATVLRSDPENLVALAALARVRAAEGRFDAAVRLVERALTLDPQNLDLLVTRGLVESDRGDFEAALKAFEAALTLDPHWLDAQQQEVLTLVQLGRREKAVEKITALLAAEPENVRVGIVYAELVELPAGDLESAEQRLRELAPREPHFADGWRVLGRVLEAQNRHEEAVETYLQGLNHQPLDGPLHARLGTLLTRLRHQAATGHLKKALSLMSRPPASVHHSLASLAIRRRDWKEVEKYARQALEIDSTLSSSWNQLGAALEEQGRRDEALTTYARAFVEDPKNWQAEFNRGLLLRQLERFQEAVTAFEQVLSIRPDHGGSHFELGILYFGPLDDPKRGTQHLNRVIAVESGGPRAKQAQEILRQLAN